MTTQKNSPRPMERLRAKLDAHFISKETPKSNNIALADVQARKVIFTAIPSGTTWCVKRIDPNGIPSRFGRFPCRADAMRTATRLAEKIGARAVT